MSVHIYSAKEQPATRFVDANMPGRSLAHFSLLLDLLDRQGHRFSSYEEVEAFLESKARSRVRRRRAGLAKAAREPRRRAAA